MPLSDREEYNAYMRDYMLRRYYERRSLALQQLGNACANCGASENLEFDHIDPSIKSFPISKLWSISYSRFQAELSKCQILCYDCHKEKHKSKALHGTPQRYWRGCRCTPCTAAYSEYNKKYKQNRPL